MVCDVEGADGVASGYSAGRAGGAAAGAAVAVGEDREDAGGDPGLDGRPGSRGRCGPPPQELLTMCGRRSGRGFCAVQVGGRQHPLAGRQQRGVASRCWISQPLAAIHWAPGATPIWLRRRRRRPWCPSCGCRARCCRTGPRRVAADPGRVEPVVVVVEGAVAVVAAVLVDQRRVVERTPVSMLPTTMPSPSNAELLPDAVGTDVGRCPIPPRQSGLLPPRAGARPGAEPCRPRSRPPPAGPPGC